jgi:hypothetical protein
MKVHQRLLLPHNPTDQTIPCPRCGGSGTIPSGDVKRKARLITLAHEWADEHGFPPTAKDWRGVKGTKWPSYLTCVRVFGSWDAFIQDCGWEPRGRGRPIK